MKVQVEVRPSASQLLICISALHTYACLFVPSYGRPSMYPRMQWPQRSACACCGGCSPLPLCSQVKEFEAEANRDYLGPRRMAGPDMGPGMMPGVFHCACVFAPRHLCG